MMSHERPDESPCVTVALRSVCPACGRNLDHGRRYCSNACRQLAYRRRHEVPVVPLPPSGRATTVFACPSCETYLLGEQRCPDCNVFARRVGPGGECPHCGGIVAVTELVDQEVMPTIHP
jgi:predicted amidophosphoribosyltransferase